MQAYLILANGTVLAGQSVGCPGTTVGEVVFATGMVGFQETLTDPSYYGQIITQTYPLIGNYGFNSEDMESGRIWARGYIVREACTTPSNFRCEETLDAFLKKHGIIGIEGVDTRSLTRTLRESGVMNGAITTEFDPAAEPERLAQLMPAIQGYAVTGAVAATTCREAKTYEPTGGLAEGARPLHVALLDLGCKNNIVRCLQKRGCRVTVLPARPRPPSWPPSPRTASCSRTAPATRPRTSKSSKTSARCWTPASPPSASAWATSSRRWRPGPRPAR